jgi:hypothetical protein
MVVTRSGRTTIPAIAAPPTNSNSVISTKPPKQTRDERRRLDALSELAALGSAILEQGAKRQRRQARHPDADFYAALTTQKKDAGKAGGLVAGSGHHYTRGSLLRNTYYY